MELTKMEQRYDAVLGVIRDSLTGNLLVEVAGAGPRMPRPSRAGP